MEDRAFQVWENFGAAPHQTAGKKALEHFSNWAEHGALIRKIPTDYQLG